MSGDFQEIRDIKGRAAEYHINNTLHSDFGAVRFSESNSYYEDVFLFDGILLPAPKTNRDQPFTEVDHLLVCTKGVFSIETKSIAGKVFGEKDSKKWHSAQASAFKKDGLYDRGFTNPFRQNSFHILAINNLLKGFGIKTWVENFVAVIDADEYGWEPGHWGSEKFDNLFFSAKEIVGHLKELPDKLSKEDVRKTARLLNPYYLDTSKNMEEFTRHHK
ncbi:hypothetical protein JCM30760_26810 [Thiomicrorhabdus hydrogeniphila]